MTLLQYVSSLQDTGLSQEEIFAKAQEFKGRTETTVEEAKTNDSQKDPSSESSDNTGSKSETGSSVPPGQTIDRGDGYEYKFEIDPNDKSKGIYYTRKTGADDWTNASANNSTDEGKIAEASIANLFGHSDFDDAKREQYFSAQQQQRKQTEDQRKKKIEAVKQRLKDDKYEGEILGLAKGVAGVLAGDDDKFFGNFGFGEGKELSWDALTKDFSDLKFTEAAARYAGEGIEEALDAADTLVDVVAEPIAGALNFIGVMDFSDYEDDSWDGISFDNVVNDIVTKYALEEGAIPGAYGEGYDFAEEAGDQIEASVLNVAANMMAFPKLVADTKKVIGDTTGKILPQGAQDFLNNSVMKSILNASTGGVLGAVDIMSQKQLVEAGEIAYDDFSEKAEGLNLTLMDFGPVGMVETSWKGITGQENKKDAFGKDIIGEDGKPVKIDLTKEQRIGAFVTGAARTTAAALGSLPSVAQSMIPYVGIASIVAGEAAATNMESAKDGRPLDYARLGHAYVVGAAEGLLELTTKKIGGKMFKSLAGAPKEVIEKSLLKYGTDILKDFGKEGLSETATLLLTQLADAVYKDEVENFLPTFSELLDTFMIGGLMGGGMASVGAGANIVKSTIGYKNIKTNLKGTQYSDLSGMFDPNADIEVDAGGESGEGGGLQGDLIGTRPTIETEDEVEVQESTSEPVSNKDVTDKTRSNRSSKTSKQDNVENTITTEKSNQVRNEVEFMDKQRAEDAKNNAVRNTKNQTADTNLDQQADNAFNVLQNPQTEKFLNTELKRKVESGQMTTDKSNEIKANFKAKQGAANRISGLGYTGQNRAKVIDLLAEKSSLEATVKKTQDSELTKAESERINEINSELRQMPRSEAQQEAINKQVEKDVAFTEKFRNIGTKDGEFENAVGENKAVQSFESTAEFNEFLAENNIAGDANTDAVILGNGQIIINKQHMREAGAIGAGRHEILHKILKSEFSGPNGEKLKNEFLKILKETDPAGYKLLIDKINSLYTKKEIQDAPDEYLTQYASLLAEGDIPLQTFVEKPSLVKRLGDFFSRILSGAANKNTTGQDVKPTDVSFKDGQDLYDFVRGYVKDSESGVLSERSKELAERGRGQQGTQSAARKLTPEQDQLAQDKVKEIQELQEEANELAEKYKRYKRDSEGNVLKDKQGNPILDPIKGAKQQRLEKELAEQIKATVDSFVESRTKALYDPIAPDNKRNVTRQEFVQSMKSDINAMIVSEFKAKQPLEKFITSRGFVRANSLAQRLGIKSVEQGIDQSIDTASNITTKTDGDVKTETETRTAQSPRATTQFTPDFVENLEVNAEGKTEAEVNEEVQKQFDEAIAKDLEAMGPVTTFGQTKDIGPALAALMEKATQGRTEVDGKIVKTPGMPAKVFMEKAKNIAKKDAVSGALTAVKQYLDANAQRDFNNLPDAFAPGSGKATFIPENVKKALYKKNDKDQFVLDKSKTLADYKALLGDMVKPVYRASEATTIKGLIGLSLRNRIFEQAVPDAVARKTTGVKFAKSKIKDSQLDKDFDYEKALKTKVKVNSAEGQKQLTAIANVRTKKEVNRLLDLPNITITQENRAALQTELLDLIESNPNFDLEVFIASKLENGGALRVRTGSKSEKATAKKLKAWAAKNGIKLNNNTPYYLLSDGTFIKAARGQISRKSNVYKKELKKLIDQGLDIETAREQAIIGKKFVPPKLPKGVNLVPAKNSLYYGQSDPNYQAALEAATENTKRSDKPYREARKVSPKLAKTAKGKALFKLNQKILEDVALKLEAMVEANPANIKFASMVMEGAYQATSGLVKIAAPINSESINPEYSTDPKAKSNQRAEGKGEKFREEHSPPASTAGGSLIWAIKNGQVKEVMKGVKANYGQTLLSKVDDAKIDRAGLDSTAGEGINIMTPNAGIRRLAAVGKILKEKYGISGGPGINLNTIVDFETGKTFAEIENVGVKSKASKSNPNIVYAQNSLISEQIKGDLETDITMDKAAIKKFDPHGMIEIVSNRLFGESNYFKLSDSQKEAVQKEMISKNIGKLTQARIEAYEPIAALEFKSSKSNANNFGDKLNDKMTIAEQLTVLGVYDKAARKARALDTPKKGISVFDFDDTLARTKEKVIVNNLDGTSIEISAAKFAELATQLESEGATFDFSNFEGVSDGTQKGPLADLALRRQDKFGSKDIFVLTARPQASATAIKIFLDGIGLNLPIENITGLADGSPGAKGNWVAQKAADGYNDFYFADDAYKNVEAVQEVLSQVDVDSEVQIAKFSKSKVYDQVVNEMIEDSTGIGAEKTYSKARAQTVGAKKGRFSFFTTPSAEDFLGLMYNLLGKGKKGDAQLKFIKDNLIDPYNKAELLVTRAKVQAAKDFRALKSNLKSLPKSLSKQTGIGGFTFSHAVRVAAWTRQGLTVPGLSKRDLKELNDFVNNDAELNTFVDELIKIQKGKPYPAPTKDWLGGNITSDILNDINKVNRKEYLQEWQENVDIIFSEKNMNKLEAAFGPRYVEALRDQLRRMKSGSNRPIGGSRVVNQLLDWLNNSVGAIMFLNTRSAVLQTLSAVNFIGVGNNGVINAAKAFANQKQFWKDFMTLMNSPYLVERRNGLKINVSESEIADAVAESSNKAKSVLGLLLNKGFVLTRFADSFAIAVGGSAFYRNQLQSYLDQGMDQKLAEQKAFEDFYEIAEKNQQSSNPSKISQQQASGAGRVILAFANTPMQYARIIKRSSQDLINGRGDPLKHIGTIAFYGVVQNLVFNALQNALFALGFEEDDEEKDKNKEEKMGRIANGMADSLLAGLGIQGKAVLALKNSLIKIAEESNKKSPKFMNAVYELFDFSPPLDSKFRKLRSAANTFTWERKNIIEKGFSLDNPAYLATAQVISGLTNLPLDRAVSKMNNIRGIMSEQSERWQKVALALGWSTWDLGLGYYGGFDPVKPLTPEQQYDLDVSNMKKDTTSAQQKQTLLDLGLTRAEIKKLKYEEDRVKKIIALQNKKKDGKDKP